MIAQGRSYMLNLCFVLLCLYDDLAHAAMLEQVALLRYVYSAQSTHGFLPLLAGAAAIGWSLVDNGTRIMCIKPPAGCI